jgi:REP element-mobilizing transposase RayT
MAGLTIKKPTRQLPLFFTSRGGGVDYQNGETGSKNKNSFDKTHGGSTRVGKRKTVRPIDPLKPLHIVMRSRRARGLLNLLNRDNSDVVDTVLARCARKWRVKVYKYANVGNHIHMVIKGHRRENIQNFFRECAGAIAFQVTKACKGRPFGRFWDQVIFSRVVEWGRSFRVVLNYVELNEWEPTGIPRNVLRQMFAASVSKGFG